MKNTIFVQIASYRDPDLKNTIQSMVDNAKYPNNLVVGICRQIILMIRLKMLINGGMIRGSKF